MRSHKMGGIFVLFALAACVMGESFHYYGHDYDRTPLGDAIDKASMKMLKEGFESSIEKNVVASPLGVLTLLSLYSSGAGDDSKAEIYRTLGGTDGKKLSDSYSGLSQQFSAMDPSYLTLANKIYVSDGYKLADNFTLAAESYKSEVELINFSAKAAAVEKINQWANEKTRGHIKSPVSPDAITSDTVAALFNVIFFQGHWHVPFEAAETKDKDFHIDEKTTVKKPTMHLLQSLFYHSSQDLDAQLIELPYKESGFRMVVVLPNEINGLPSLLKKVAEKGILADVFALEPSGRDVNLDMPKFDIKSKWNLNNILPKMGISSIFSEPAPGVVRDSSVKVSKAFQEAFIKVDEEGATAGAFTGFIGVQLSLNYRPKSPIQFKVDHPFLYMILHEDKIIFTGTYSN